MIPRPVRSLVAAAAVALVAGPLGGCAASPVPNPADGPASSPSPPAPPPDPNYGQNASGGVNAPEHRDAPYVVMVSLDGFRPDYLDRYEAPNLRRIAAEGVRAEAMIPVFPTKTFPSHYSLATGLHPDRHGLVANTMYDPERGRWFRIGDRVAVEDSTWYGGEPIWVTAERQGMVAASYFWVGSEAAVGGVRPTFWYRFNTGTPAASRVDRVLEWLALPEEHRPHLVTLYFADTDAVGHDHGPDSPEVAEAVARVDELVGRLARGIEALPHGDEVYLVIVSDHGMAGYGADDLVELETDRLPEGVVVAATGPYASLHLPGATDDELRALRDTVRAVVGDGGDAHLRSEMPERFHYRSSARAGDVIVVARGTRMIEPSSAVLRFRPGYMHGWDNRMPEMGALFLARGPDLPEGRMIPPFEAVHVYPFVARILGLETPDVDGRVEVLGGLLEGGGR